MFGSSFANSNVPSLFGGQTQSATMFGGTTMISGTPNKFNPVNSTDTIQKGGQNTTVQTKIHSISAMPEYESKSFEELKWEDYQANRKSGNLSMFGNTGNVFGNTNAAFSTFSNPATQQSQPAFGNTSLFNNTQSQLNTSFTNNKPLFGANTSNTGFGNLASNTKPSMFGATNTTNQVANKPLFGGTSTNTPLFGSNTNQSSNIFGATNQQPVASTSSFFGGLNKPQTSTQGGFFGSNTGQTSSAFTFNTPSTSNTGGLFGAQNNAVKPFGNTTSSFGFGNTNSSTSIFGNTQTTGSLFGQNAQTGFGVNTSKPSLFSSTNTAFNTAQPTITSQSLFQPSTASAFGTNSSLFGANQQKPAATFGNSGGLFNTTSQPSLFGTQNTTPAFGQTNLNTGGSLFNTSNQQTNNNPVITAPIGYTDPTEAYMQQKMFHMKFLNLLNNKPYAVNKLFINSNFNKDEALNDNKQAVTQNSLSCAIKRNDQDQHTVRRRILQGNPSVKNFHRIFSGFDDDDAISNKSSQSMIDKCFLTKREDWKCLPPDAFEKLTHRSLNSSNSVVHEQSVRKDSLTNENSSSSAGSLNLNGKSSKNLENDLQCSTPIRNENINKPELIVSPIEKEQPKTHKQNVEIPVTKSHVLFDMGNIKEYDDKSSKSPIKKEHISGVILTKPNYYISPEISVLDKLVTENNNGEYECWVENFIIGRKDYGSIKFLNETNVYGLNLDKLVEIERCEVCVYPDDSLKPEVGEGINKHAQIFLHKVYPTDKSTGELIKDTNRLKLMNFERKLIRMTEKLDAKFHSYCPEDGLWVFEVDHFSKYKFDDTDESEDENIAKKVENSHENRNNQPSPKKSTITKQNLVIRAEADSMTGETLNMNTNALKEKIKLPINDGYAKMRNALFSQMSDDDDNDYISVSHDKLKYGFLHKESLKSKNTAAIIKDFKRDEEEPVLKRFETDEMGKSIMNSCIKKQDYQIDFTSYQNELFELHKPIELEELAFTQIIHSNNALKDRKLPIKITKTRDYVQTYIPDQLFKYIENPKSNYFENELVFSNKFRCGFSQSNNNGLLFITKEKMKIPDKDLKMTSLTYFPKSNTNFINLKTFIYEPHIEEHKKYLKSALTVSYINDDNKFDTTPLWIPRKNFDCLNEYIKNTTDDNDYISRIINLINALWGELKMEDEEINTPIYLKQLARKQNLTQWIRDQCHNDLKQLLKDYQKKSIFKLILECLCSGELTLATQLASMKHNYRLSLIIAQVSGTNIKYKDLVIEQLCLWCQNREDILIDEDLLKIYTLLSGQTNLVLSDGNIINVFDNKNWWQVLGCYIWFIQPYLTNLKDIITLYEDDYNNDVNIPKPRPFNNNKKSIDKYDELIYKDICYQLIKLYIEPVYDLDKLLNPPCISTNDQHYHSWNWYETWNIALLLKSFNYDINNFDRICLEYGSELERCNLWEWSIFILLFINDDNQREKLIMDFIYRNITSINKTLNGQENFLINELHISKELIYEGKALYCKMKNNYELEAYHWFEAGYYEKSNEIYCYYIIPKLMINDYYNKINDILEKFIKNNYDKKIINWYCTGEIYLLYLTIQYEMKSLKLTNKLVDYSLFMDLNINDAHHNDGDDIDELDLILSNQCTDVDERINKLKISVRKLLVALDNYHIETNEQRICKKQMDVLCKSYLEICDSD